MQWRKSSRSGYPDDHWCVEIGFDDSPVVAIRDSKDPNSPHIQLSREDFGSLLGKVKEQ